MMENWRPIAQAPPLFVMVVVIMLVYLLIVSETHTCTNRLREGDILFNYGPGILGFLKKEENGKEMVDRAQSRNGR